MAGGLELRDGYDATIEWIKAQDEDKYRPGKTALRWHEEVNSSEPDHDRRTPLLDAFQNRYEEVVEILLGHEEVSPNQRNNAG